MKHFTDLFIRRPVLASVVSLFIFFLGLRAVFTMQVQQFPTLKNTVITINTAYVGASQEVVQGFVTHPIQQAVASADGIEYMTSTTTDGLSQISVYVKLNYDPNAAFTSVMSKVSQVSNQLPTASQRPVITKTTGSTIALMYLSFSSKTKSLEQITDYISRVVQTKLETVSGVSSADIFGGKTFAMRIWLHSDKMAALRISPQQVTDALLANNFQSSAGRTKGEYVAYAINSQTDLHNEDEFNNLVVFADQNQVVRLKDIATVKLGSADYDSSVSFNGEKAIFVGISATPEANPLAVISQVKVLFKDIVATLPSGLEGKICYDATAYIRSSLHEVIKTIAEASLIVILVIFIFLGSLRAVIIPVITIPLSLVGVCAVMSAVGYSINLLTLLAMVLAIGLVVDDAIVVVENIYRHLEEGLSPFDAAIKGAREITGPVIAMTITLAAVYFPIGLMGGLTGALFREFALTLAFSVIISGIVALTLSPMMCSKLLNLNQLQSGLSRSTEERFKRWRNAYHRKLTRLLTIRPVILVFALIVFALIFFFYHGSNKELAPDEDQSVLFVMANAPIYANIDYTHTFTNEINRILKSYSIIQDYFVIDGMNGVNSAFAGTILKPWNERQLSQKKFQPQLQEALSQVAGLQTMVFPFPSLPVSGDNMPIDFVLTSTDSVESLVKNAQQLIMSGMQSGLFMFLMNPIEVNKPALNLSINKSEASLLGLTMQDIGNALGTSLSGNYINYFNLAGRSYEVIPQLKRADRLNPNDLNQIYITTPAGENLPLSTLIQLNYSVEPTSLTQFQQLNSITIQGMPAFGVSLGTALHFLQTASKEQLPNTVFIDYAGQSRQYIEQGNALMITFFFALIVIYLVLAAQFESFRDPFIILFSVPMSICGALIPLYLQFASLNIYTQIGLITLIGLISKHGILMVEFANKLRLEKQTPLLEAIIEAASTRFRPIVMTTAAMVVGVIPLLLSSGAGAVSRFDIGLVIAVGMLIGTCFTLFVVPTVYTYLAKK